jgi:hypothetical protein
MQWWYAMLVIAAAFLRKLGSLHNFGIGLVMP